MSKLQVILGVILITIIIVMFSFKSLTLEKVDPSFDRSKTELPITVYFYDTATQVTKKYRELHDIDRGVEIASRKGFANWPEWRNDDDEPVDPPADAILDCEIHTVKPKNVDDDATLTLGHELLHCLYGSYHQQH